MPRKEKSFFGKIMGGNTADDDQQTAQIIQEEIIIEDDGQQYEEDELEELVEEDLLEESEEAEDFDYEEVVVQEVAPSYEEPNQQEPEQPTQVHYEEPTPEETVVHHTSSAVSQKDEDWMNDYEGALNIDMYQTKDNVIIKSTIAGVRPDDIDITVANDMVTIKGKRQREESIAQDDYFYQECYWGSFARSVIVPVDIDSEEIEADLKDGILTIVIPKAAKAKTKKVKVRGL